MIIDFAQDIPIPRCRYGSAADMSRKVARFGPCVPPCVSGKKTAGKIPVRLNLLPLKSVCGRAAPTGYISPQKTGYEKRNDVQNTHLRRTPHGKPESDRHAGRLGTESAQPGRDDLHRPARPVRHHAAGRRGAFVRRVARNGLASGPRIRDPRDGPRRRTGIQERQDTDRRNRGGARKPRRAERFADSAVHDRGSERRRRRTADEIPLSGSEAQSAPQRADAASPDGSRDT